MVGVIAKHRAAVGNIEDQDSVPADLLAAARKAWDDALDLGEVSGFRNAQATVLAPTGTISFMMDCDTTGVEPDFSLVKSKKLVGGGEITIVNKTVAMALEKLGYAPTEVDEIVAFVDDRNSVVGAPYLKTEHYPVFDCAIGERAIHYMGHVKMMGAVQPFISGAISKTVNMPESATVKDVQDLFLDSWKLGVKAVAIYRDNCKVAQPLSGKKDGAEAVLPPPQLDKPARRRLPLERTEVGRKFQVGDYEGYIHVGLYEDGTPGDIFVDIAKEGTTLAGLMNSFMISVSLGLQYGVPLEVYVSKFAHMRFEPSGITNDPDIRVAKSIADYVFRWMGKKFLTPEQQEEIGILTPEIRARLATAAEALEGKPLEESAPASPARPEGPVQRLRGRGGVRQVRRPDGSHRARATRAGTAGRTLGVERWVDLVEHLNQFPPPERIAALDRLSGLAADAFDSDMRERIWAEAHKLLRHHRSFPEAEWSLASDELERIEAVADLFTPSDPVHSNAWMFNDYLPDIGEARAEYHEQEARARSASCRGR